MINLGGAKYIKGAADRSGFISSPKPIIAVSGKSNVGKSSFINMLANSSRLARVSKEPGRTRLVNYFDFPSFILADLPGYGYAKVSKQEKAKWGKTMDEFFLGDNADFVIALVDIRHDPTQDDMNMISFLYQKGLPFCIVATKADKLSRAGQGARRQALASVLGVGAMDIIVLSSETRQGLDKITDKIEQICKNKGEER